MEEMLWEIIAKLETVAPHVWALAVRQVWTNAVRDSIVGLLSSIFVCVTFRWVRQSPNDSDKDVRWIIFGTCALLFGSVAIIALYSTIGAVLNPQWAAMGLIRSLIP